MNESPRPCVDWVGAEEVPAVLRECAEAEVQALRESCRHMRAMRIELRRPLKEYEFHLCCRCREHRRSIRVTRDTLGDALAAFERVLQLRCTP
jgi:hypothetical protein